MMKNKKYIIAIMRASTYSKYFMKTLTILPVVWLMMFHRSGIPLWDLMVQWFYRWDNLLVASQTNHGTTVYGEAATVGLRVFRIHVIELHKTHL